MRVERLGPGDDQRVLAASHLFDGPATPEATHRFLEDERHHLLLACEDGRAIGFVSGVELTHPDKGSEMLLYELGVDEAHRRRGVGRALLRALGELARERGCYGMFVLTEHDNAPALATYAVDGARREDGLVMFTWEPPAQAG